MDSNKITLEEFFKVVGIHCNTKEKAIKLLSEFSKLGKRWNTGELYLDDNNWDDYKEDTVYYNDGTYSDLKYAKRRLYKIYEFEDIIFE